MVRWKAKLDKLVIFFTREMGKLLAVAPGAMRIPNRFGGSMEPLNYGILRLYCSTSGRYYVKDFEIVNSFLGVRSSPERLSVALSYLFFLYRILPYEVPEVNLFDASFSFFKELEKGSEPEVLKAVAMIKALHFLGFLPDFRACSRCGRKLAGGAHIENPLSGPVCERCSLSDSLKLGGETIALIRASLDKPFGFFGRVRFSSRALNEVFSYLSVVSEKLLGGVELEFSGSNIQA